MVNRHLTDEEAAMFLAAVLAEKGGKLRLKDKSVKVATQATGIKATSGSNGDVQLSLVK